MVLQVNSINDNIVFDVREKFETDCFIIKSNVMMVSEYDFFDKNEITVKRR